VLPVQLTEEMLDSVLATNTKGVAFAFKYQLPAIEKSGGKGSVLVNSSCAGTRATANEKWRSATSQKWHSAGVYAASKAAANLLAQYAVSDSCLTTHMSCSVHKHCV
jgi:NAD(P)-dependent dehydrogenase (short-subunit alcohol dehydrogenase family)